MISNIITSIRFKCNVSRSARLIGRDKIKLARGCSIYSGATLCAGFLEYDDFSSLREFDGDGHGSIEIDERSTIHHATIVATYGGIIRIGRNVSINPYSVLYGHGGLLIGENTRIATSTIIVASNHKFSRHDIPICQQGLDQKGIVIGKDVWIGANCCVLDGVEIGDGVVIGAGSIVNKSVPCNQVWAGNPARFIKKRII